MKLLIMGLKAVGIEFGLFLFLPFFFFCMKYTIGYIIMKEIFVARWHMPHIVSLSSRIRLCISYLFWMSWLWGRINRSPFESLKVWSCLFGEHDEDVWVFKILFMKIFLLKKINAIFKSCCLPHVLKGDDICLM